MEGGEKVPDIFVSGTFGVVLNGTDQEYDLSKQ